MQKFKKSTVWLWIGILVALIALLSPIITYFVISKLNLEGNTLSNLGTAGDYLGGTTFLLALASILFVISSIMIQKEELELSRKELRDSIDEQKKANQTMQIQQFETSFYNLLNHLNRSKNNDAISLILKEAIDKKLSLDYSIFKDYLLQFGDEFKNHTQPIVETFEKVKFGQLAGILKHTFENKDSLKEVELFLKNQRNWLNTKFDIDALKKITESNIPRNSYSDYLIENYSSIIEKRAENYFFQFNNQYNYPLNSFIEMLVILIEHISKNDNEHQDFYFKVLKSQLTNQDKLVLGFIIKNKLHYTLRAYALKYPELEFECYHM